MAGDVDDILSVSRVRMETGVVTPMSEDYAKGFCDAMRMFHAQLNKAIADEQTVIHVPMGSSPIIPHIWEAAYPTLREIEVSKEDFEDQNLSGLI